MSLFELYTVIPGIDGMLFMLFLALGTSSLAAFFQKCMQPNMIFEFYFNWLDAIALRYASNKSTWNKILFKIIHPLGYCVYCNGFWIGIGLWFLYYGHFSFTIFMFQGLVWLFTTTFNKLKYNKM